MGFSDRRLEPPIEAFAFELLMGLPNPAAAAAYPFTWLYKGARSTRAPRKEARFRHEAPNWQNSAVAKDQARERTTEATPGASQLRNALGSPMQQGICICSDTSERETVK